jgi:hypothetical protein
VALILTSEPLRAFLVKALAYVHTTDIDKWLKSQLAWDRKSNVISTKVLHKNDGLKIDITAWTQQFSTLGCVNLINSARVFYVICRKTRGTSLAVLKRNPSRSDLIRYAIDQPIQEDLYAFGIVALKAFDERPGNALAG